MDASLLVYGVVAVVLWVAAGRSGGLLLFAAGAGLCAAVSFGWLRPVTEAAGWTWWWPIPVGWLLMLAGLCVHAFRSEGWT